MVLVLRRARGGGDAGYYACRRPYGAARLFGVDLADAGEYPPDEQTFGLQVAGALVAGWRRLNAGSAAACSKYQAQAVCPAPDDAVRVMDVRTGRRVDLATSEPAPAPRLQLVLSGVAVAWLARGGDGSPSLFAARVRSAAAGGPSGSPQLVAHGAITLDSLRLAGTSLAWVQDGLARAADLP
ncbi:MAG: hypothetical protein NVSMB51_16720 [Solirubrobacteraceae bacterium]